MPLTVATSSSIDAGSRQSSVAEHSCPLNQNAGLVILPHPTGRIGQRWEATRAPGRSHTARAISHRGYRLIFHHAGGFQSDKSIFAWLSVCEPMEPGLEEFWFSCRHLHGIRRRRSIRQTPMPHEDNQPAHHRHHRDFFLFGILLHQLGVGCTSSLVGADSAQVD